MNCSLYEYSSTDETGVTSDVYRQVPTDVSECGKSNLAEFVILTGYEYQELSVKAGEVTTLDQAVASIDPVEISAVYGAAFAAIFFLSAVAYKIKVAKKIIKLT